MGWTGTYRAVVLAIVVVGALFTGCGVREGIDGPVAAVLDAKGTIALVDLKRGMVVDTVRLRSWATDIDADPGQGVFVTAQSGGVGSDADDAMGIIRVRGRRAVEYVTLPRPNPLGVEALEDGLVLVDHGWMEQDGMFACVVDSRARRVVRTGYVPDNNGPIIVAAGAAWSPGIDVLTDRPSLRRVDTESLESVEAPDSGGSAFVECETPEGLAGWMRYPGGRPPLLALFDAGTGAVVSTAPVEFEDGPGRLACVDGRLVGVDFSAEDYERTGARLLVFDAKTLEPSRTLPAPGVPSDVAAWGDKAVVVNQRDQTLQVIDPATGRVETTVKLPKMERLQLRVAVLDNSGDPTR